MGIASVVVVGGGSVVVVVASPKIVHSIFNDSTVVPTRL